MLPVNEITAWFDEQYAVTISSNIDEIDTEIRDPWWLDPGTGGQPNSFHDVTAGVPYEVFLNQGGPDPNNLIPPYYSLRAAPRLMATESNIWKFSTWAAYDSNGNPDTNGDWAYLASPNNYDSCAVVFKQEGVEVRARYVAKNTSAGDLVINPNEELVIPAGANITCNSGPGPGYRFRIIVKGNLTFEGTPDALATLKSDSPDELWGGIMLVGISSLTANYAKIEGAEKAIIGPDMIYTYNHNIENTNVTVDIVHTIFDHNNFSFYFDPRGCPDFNIPDFFSAGGILWVDIENCTFASDNSHALQWISIYKIQDFGDPPPPCPGFLGGGSGSIIQYIYINNIFTNSDFDLVWEDSEDVLLSYVHWYNNLFDSSLVYNRFYPDGYDPGEGGTTDCFYGNGNLSGDPLYVDELNGDYHLTTNSPAIDAGRCDLDGDGHSYVTDPDDQDPDGTRMDMGAYYYDAIPSAPVLSISGSWGDHPTLYWTDGGEPDIDHFVLKKTYINDSGEMTVYINISTGINEYTDNGIVIQKFGNTIAKYWVKSVDWINQESPYSNMKSTSGLGPMWKQVTKIDNLPLEFALHENHPNPFNPITTIKYDLPEESFVELRIFNLLGEEIRTLVVGNESAGFKRVMWDGKDNKGNLVSSGMYIYNFNAKSVETEKDFHKTNKMLLLR